jgi:hypothetical protein
MLLLPLEVLMVCAVSVVHVREGATQVVCVVWVLVLGVCVWLPQLLREVMVVYVYMVLEACAALEECVWLVTVLMV